MTPHILSAIEFFIAARTTSRSLPVALWEKLRLVESTFTVPIVVLTMLIVTVYPYGQAPRVNHPLAGQLTSIGASLLLEKSR